MSKPLRVLIRKFDPFESAIEKQWQSFQQATGNDLTLVTESLDLHPLSDRVFGAKSAKDWDITFLSSDWFAQAYEADVLHNLTPMLTQNPPDDYPQGWSRSLLDLQRFDDVVLGLPYHDGPECLIYRKDLFEDVGEQVRYREMYKRPLRPPQSWPEFLQIAQFFHRPERGLYGTVFAAYPDGHNTVYDFCLQLWTRGGELFDADGNLQLDTPQAVEALTFYRGVLNGETAVHPQSRDYDSVKSGFAFARGEVAMMINWFGFAAMAETIAKSQVKGKVNIANIPSGGKGQPVSLNAYWILGIAAHSAHKETAYQFLHHCASAPMDKLLTIEGGIGCRQSTWADPDINATIPFYHQMSDLHTYARELPRLSNWSEISHAIDELVLAVINTDTEIHTLVANAQRKLP